MTGASNPLLQEYFYNDGERLKAVLGKAFIEELPRDSSLFDTAPESFDPDTSRIEIRKFDGDDAGFAEALQQMAGLPVHSP